MVTKWRSRSVSLVLLGAVVVMWTLTLFAAANVYRDSKYFGADAYFKSADFQREISNLYALIQQVHIEAPHFSEKSREEQIGNNSYYNLEQDAQRLVQDRWNNIQQKYDSRIDTAKNRGDNDEVDRLEAEMDAKLQELTKEKNAAFEEKFKAAVEAKQKEFAVARKNLDSYKTSVYYTVKNERTAETFSNVSNDVWQKAQAQRSMMHTVELPSRELRYLNAYGADPMRGTLYILYPTIGSGNIQSDYLSYLSMQREAKNSVYIFVAILLLTLGLSAYVAKYRRADFSTEVYHRVMARVFPLDVRAWATFIAGAALFGVVMENDIFYVAPTYVSLYQVLVVALAAVLLLIVCSGLRGAVKLLQDPEMLAWEWQRSLTSSFWHTLQDSLEQRGLWFKLLVFTLIVGIMGFLPVVVAASEAEAVVVVFTFAWYILFLLIVLPYLMRKVKQLRAMIRGVEQMAQGNFDVMLPAKGRGQLSRMAMHINNMKYGLQLSLEKQRVSDRLKTELITNVSHDLKTPLTSIINYVDLLKKEGLSGEQSAHYLEVLDRKTQRLKVLIEDLFEASKMASGATELYWEKVDVAALLTQALAEFSDKIEASSLTFRVNVPYPHMYAMLDGKKTWRVFENLIANALKYALPGTRVYVSLMEDAERITFIIQNISQHELNFDAQELFERFKRGDQSRQTEGSGLGLAIARSIVELQGGTLAIDIDGDQFKVIAVFEKRLELAERAEG
ncbi:histidine kinase dimerization/phospho-acceptor domain-containing protein [Paenibacillus ferrarius]|uniref:histidine kinase dimerization/phospho-acceptor domain-containing protein n=1 Tax=Paenibacillus ferrarius TaxID=1469647 RepID=UPI003D29B513